MVDVASIIIAVISFVGTLLVAGVTAWFSYFSAERKRLTEAEKLIAKYRDPLLLACQDLQSRLYNITDENVTVYFRQRGEKKENVLLYTAFLVGQYLSWTYILRRQAQFLRFSTEKDNRELTKVLAGISFAFGTDGGGPDSAPFMLWRGHQSAIGEMMTTKDAGELFCIGYAAFHKKWGGGYLGGTVGGAREISGTIGAPGPGEDGEDGEDIQEDDGVQVGRVGVVGEDGEDRGNTWSGEFRPWFRSIVEGVAEIAKARDEGRATIPDQRLRRLQHLLLDLIGILDEKGLRTEAKYTHRCHRAKICDCSKCIGKTACPCNRCKDARGLGDV